MPNNAAQPSRTPADPTLSRSAPQDVRDDRYPPVAPGERACCCSARPVARVVLPPTSQRDHAVDLLMCGHHYRRSITSLAAQDARVFDASGALLFSGDLRAPDRVPAHATV